jgi:hypothetical protein
MKHLSHSEFAHYIGNSTVRQRKNKFHYSCYPHAAVLQLIATRKYSLLRQLAVALSGRVKIGKHYKVSHTFAKGKVFHRNVHCHYVVGTLLRHIADVMDWDTNNINVGLRVAKYGIADKADRKAIIAAYLQGYDQEVAEIVNNIKGYGIETPSPTKQMQVWFA